MISQNAALNLLVTVLLVGFFIAGYWGGHIYDALATKTKTKQVYVVDKATYVENATLILQTQALQAELVELQAKLDETRVIHATITSYSPNPDQTDEDPFITASMERVQEGRVAVSRDLFYKGWVFGRRIYIEGKGIFIINDLMHSRKTNQIDIFRFSTTKAEEFGVQHTRVVLLD